MKFGKRGGPDWYWAFRIFRIAISVRSQETKPAEAQPTTPAGQKSALEPLPADLVHIKGGMVSKDSLKGKIVGLYFSAHWCPPCRAFTPQLVAFRDAHAAEAIKQDFYIRGIPSLIILGADGREITRDGRGDVARLKDDALAEWKK